MPEESKLHKAFTNLIIFALGAGLTAAAVALAVSGIISVPGFKLARERSVVTSASSLYTETDPEKAFPSWNPESEALAALVSFIDEATDAESEGYVEPEERIAVFDMDGTFISETAPVYLDYEVFCYRVLDDPSYEAREDLVTACTEMRALMNAGEVPSAYDGLKTGGWSQVFAGLTPEQLNNYLVEYIETQPAKGFSGMMYSQSVYEPMRELMNYLRAYGFELYVVSASERSLVRAMASSQLGIEPSHVIGVDTSYSASGQGDTPAAGYDFAKTDAVLIGNQTVSNVSHTEKVFAIAREIGTRPVLAFGNSSGDYAMLNYTAANASNASLGVLVVNDDNARDYGDPKSGKDIASYAEGEGWVAVSMYEDWASIYADGVEKTSLAS